MIFGTIDQSGTYSFLPENLRQCFDYVKSNNLADFDKGTHKIDGDNLFVNIVEYETTTPENRFWEAHRHYLDVHVMLRGEEQIDMNFIENLSQGEFVEQDDFLPLKGEPNGHTILRSGDFLICYPQDAHRTAVQVEESMGIKKAIFKVKI